MNGNECIVLIEVAGQQMLHTKCGQTGFELVELGGEFPLQTGIATFLRQFQECRHVAELRLDVAPLLQFAFQP